MNNLRNKKKKGKLSDDRIAALAALTPALVWAPGRWAPGRGAKRKRQSVSRDERGVSSGAAAGDHVFDDRDIDSGDDSDEERRRRLHREQRQEKAREREKHRDAYTDLLQSVFGEIRSWVRNPDTRKERIDGATASDAAVVGSSDDDRGDEQQLRAAAAPWVSASDEKGQSEKGKAFDRPYFGGAQTKDQWRLKIMAKVVQLRRDFADGGLVDQRCGPSWKRAAGGQHSHYIRLLTEPDRSGQSDRVPLGGLVSEKGPFSYVFARDQFASSPR